MATITMEQQDAIREFVMNHHLPPGLGTEEEACSIAAINLALRGELTAAVPECMSAVIGNWIIGVQDAMPDGMRNSFGWKSLLPLAAGTGRDPQTEEKRVALILEWMWGKVLPSLQEIANANGFGVAWRSMLAEKSAAAAAAWTGAAAAGAAWVPGVAWAAWAEAQAAAAGAAWTARVAWAAGVAWAAAAAARAQAPAWASFAPHELLRRLIEL